MRPLIHAQSLRSWVLRLVSAALAQDFAFAVLVCICEMPANGVRSRCVFSDELTSDTFVRYPAEWRVPAIRGKHVLYEHAFVSAGKATQQFSISLPQRTCSSTDNQQTGTHTHRRPGRCFLAVSSSIFCILLLDTQITIVELKRRILQPTGIKTLYVLPSDAICRP